MASSTMFTSARLRVLFSRIEERLWVKPLLLCVLSVAGTFMAMLADDMGLSSVAPKINLDFVESLLSIMASSMLVIATFAVGSMVAAYASVSAGATPVPYLWLSLMTLPRTHCLRLLLWPCPCIRPGNRVFRSLRPPWVTFSILIWRLCNPLPKRSIKRTDCGRSPMTAARFRSCWWTTCSTMLSRQSTVMERG